MADRVVKITLSAVVEDYKRRMAEAAQATRAVGTETEKLAQQKRAFEILGRASLTAGGLIAAGVGVAVKKFADFDQAMSNVAATGADARKSMRELRDAALEAGAKTVFSATESANAIEELAKAGVSAKDILGGGLRGALDLAAAGGLGVADAAGIAATALKTFNLRGTDMSHVADLLAAGAGKAMGDVSDLSQALAQGGQVAAATGLSIEETTAALSAFASQGLLGSDAGTSLKTMLQRLTPQTEEAQKQFEALGISAYDANGQFVGLSDFAGQLQAAMADLTPEARNAAMSVLFGSDAVRAANVLYKEGETGIRKWIAAVDDQGYAAETARQRLDNLKGDWEALTGALDSAMISMGEAADGPLRFLVQELTGLVDKFNDMPAGAQQAVGAVGAVAGAALLAGGAYLASVPKIVEYREAIALLGPTAQRAARLVTAAMRGGLVAGGVFLSVSAIESLAEALDSKLGPSVAQTENRFRNAASAAEQMQAVLSDAMSKDVSMTETQEVLRGVGQALDAAANNAERWWEGIAPADDATLGYLSRIGDQLGSLAQSDLPSARDQFAQLTGDLALNDAQIYQLLQEMDGYRDALYAAAGDTADLSDRQELLKFALGETSNAVTEAEAAVSGLQEASDDAAADLDTLGDALRAVTDDATALGAAQDDALSAINSMREAAKQQGVTLDGTDDASIRFRDSLREVAEASLLSAEEVAKNADSSKDARKEWQKGREAILDQIEAFFDSRAEAKKWADENLGSSKKVKNGLDDVFEAANKSAEIDIQTAAAEAALERIKAALNYIDTNPATVVVNNGQAGRTERKAGGGAVHGPGTGTSDSIPAMLSNGEHVIPAWEVRAAGGQEKVYAWRRAMVGGARGFASGGAVTSDSAARAVRAAERAEREARAEWEDAKAASKRAKSKKAKERAEKAEREALAELQDAKRDLRAAKDDVLSLRRSFRGELTDWRTGQRRGENFEAGTSGNGLSLVDQLFDIAAQTGGKSGQRLREQAFRSEKAYLKLEDAAEKAASRVDTAAGKLADLRNAAASMAAGVANAVRGFFNLGKLGESSEQVKTRTKRESVTVGGQTYSWEGVETYTETTTPTAGSILAGTQAAEARIKGFADKLKRLAGMGLNPKLLEELALLGVSNGEPIADALLGATSQQIADLNKSYAGVGKFSDLAGSTVADANFGSLIRLAERQLNDAERHAADIQKKLETETTRVIKAITDALTKGTKKASGGPIVGPGTGTSDDVPIWASNGEHMIPAWEVDAAGGHERVFAWRRAMVSGRAPAFAKGGPVLVPTGSQFGGAGLSLDGMHITGTFEIGGDGLGRIIDGRVETRGRALDVLRTEVV